MKMIKSMRKIKIALYHSFKGILLLTFTAVSLKSYSQPLTRKLSTAISDNLNEEVYAVTDRDLYIAGETVYIKAFCRDRGTGKPSVVSKVAYVSLLDHFSVPLVQCKLWLKDSSGSGELLIPDTLRTGRYMINACTRWMRNFSPDLFSGKIITVINPFISIEHLRIPDLQTAPDTTFSSLPGDKGISQKTFDKSPAPDRGTLTINTDSAVFGPRERVMVTVTAKNEKGEPVQSDLVVSVVKAFTYDSKDHNISFTATGDPGEVSGSPGRTLPAEGSLFLPEPEGHLLSGTVFSTGTGEPVARENIILSFIGKTSLCRFDRTDDKGAFNFVINESGRQELVIQPLNPELKDLYIELDSPWPDVFARYEPGQYFIDTARIKELNNAVVSMQVQAVYKSYRDSVKNSIGHEIRHDFYGDPSYSVRLSDFISLTSVKEVFRELLPVAFIESGREKSRFVLKNSSPDEYYLTDPFVLVDGVPVNDLDAILKISPTEIEKINVLNSRYYISDVCLDGIIDFKTLKGNLREQGINMPLFRQEFEAPSSGSDFFSPEYTTTKQKESRIPDFRNTLYWNPALKTDRDGAANAVFYTSDEPGDYLIIVEGLTPEGVQVSACTQLFVKAR